MLLEVLIDERVNIAKPKMVAAIKRIIVDHHPLDPGLFDFLQQRAILLGSGRKDKIDLLRGRQPAGEGVERRESRQKENGVGRFDEMTHQLASVEENARLKGSG